MKKVILFIAVMLLPKLAFADHLVNGIWYNIFGTNASVAFHGYVIDHGDYYDPEDIVNNANYEGDIVIPSSVEIEGIEYQVTSIDAYAFIHCVNMTSVLIPKSIVSIGRGAFADCRGLKAVHISDIEAWCKISFDYNTSLSAPSFGSTNPLRYAHHLFLNGIEIKDLVIPNNIKTINEYAFHGCSALESVNIPNTVVSIKKGAFDACDGLKTVNISDIASWCKIPFENAEANPLSIAHHLLHNGTEVEDLVIPNSVSSIGSYAFSGCNVIKYLVIPSSVTSIGTGAFINCSGLTSITIPESVTSIGGSAFSGCSNLISVTIPESVTSIGGSAFFACSGLKSITIPEGVTSIGNGAFYGCSGLTSITVPEGVTTINSQVFYNCSSLTSVKIPSSLKFIEPWAFVGCNSLQDVTVYAKIPPYRNELDDDPVFPSNISQAILYVPFGSKSAYSKSNEWNGFGQIIEIGTFSIDGINYKIASEEQKTVMVISAESSLSNVVIPSQVAYNDVTYTVNSIAQSAFEENTTITSVEIPNSVTYVSDRAFFGCTNLKTVKLPDGLNKLCFHVFSRCSSLTDITLPESLTSIDEGALYRCSSLTSVTIPSGVTEIGTHAFYYCEKLAEVKSKMVTPPAVTEQTFEGIASGAILRVPAGRMSTYQGTSGWDKFAKIEESLDGNNKCAKPTISFADGKLSFNCSTEGVDYQYTIIDDDVKTGKGNDITLGMTYHVTVYATKDGLEKSDVATMDIVISGSGTPTVRGDLNGDGQVNVADHVELTKIIMRQ